jgi:trk system potassium uptake protein TrkA
MTTTRNRTKPDESPAPEAPPDYCVLGGDHLGAAVARRLDEQGHTVSLVDETRVPEAVPARQGDPADVDLLAEAGVAHASAVVVATREDSRNLLVAQLVSAHFDVPEVLVLVNVPERCDLVADVGHEPVCATAALTDTLLDSVEGAE